MIRTGADAGGGYCGAGGNAVIPTIDAACRLAADAGVPLLISGGIGHSTVFLYDAVRNDPRYRSLPVDGRPEAHILADIAHRFWHIPRDRIVVEDRSTNCGENARFTREMLAATGIAPRAGVVLQDPTMQRRTMATLPASGMARRSCRSGTARRAARRCWTIRRTGWRFAVTLPGCGRSDATCR
jgi:uncharacterized SAM-binding protein YcdF (DUF218 family)